MYNGYRVFPGGEERPGRDADPSLPSSAVLKKEYIYTSTPPMGRAACTEPQCLHKGAFYFLLSTVRSRCRNCGFADTPTWLEGADNRGKWLKLQSPGLVFGRWMVRNTTGTSDIVTDVFHGFFSQQPTDKYHSKVWIRHTLTSFQILATLLSACLKPFGASFSELFVKSLTL